MASVCEYKGKDRKDVTALLKCVVQCYGYDLGVSALQYYELSLIFQGLKYVEGDYEERERS